MAKDEISYIVKFLYRFPPQVQQTALYLRDFIWNLYPDSNELIYDNYNALAVGYSPTASSGDAFCSFAVYSKHLNFGFNRGSEIHDADKLLSGDGSLYRYVTVNNSNDFPEAYIKVLMGKAYEHSLSRLKPGKKIIKGQTIIKSIAPVKRRLQ